MKAIKVIALICCFLLCVNTFKIRTKDESRLQTELSAQVGNKVQIFFLPIFHFAISAITFLAHGFATGWRGYKRLQSEEGLNTDELMYGFTPAEAKEIMDAIYKDMDANKDGVVSVEEFTQYFAKGNGSTPVQEIHDAGKIQNS